MKNTELENNSSKEIYGSFFLSENEFSILVRSIQEVVNEPEYYNPMPLSPDYLVGLFNLRGNIIPVIDLTSLLNIENSNKFSTKCKKIAIVENDNFCVGLLFDRTGEVFSATPEEKTTFSSENQNKPIVTGVFKLDGGERIVQILDSQVVINIDGIPKPTNGNKNYTGAKKNVKHGKRLQSITFKVAKAICALEMTAIQEILSLDRLINKSMATESCIGTFNLRGTTVPLVDFGAILGYRQPDRSLKATHGDRRVIVMKHHNGFFGLLVDSVQSIVNYFEDEIIPFPIFGKARAEMFLGCIARDNENSDIILLNANNVLSNKELSDITRGHSSLFLGKSTNEIQKKQLKQTYITFSLDSHFAVNIRDVREVINKSNQLLHPPGLSKNLCGMLNLRGEMVAVIDSRKLYGLKYDEPTEDPKIVIFEIADTKYGMVVDSVDSIIRFSSQDHLEIPELLYRGSAGKMTEDVEGAVEVEIESGEKKTFLLLNISSVSERLTQCAA